MRLLITAIFIIKKLWHLKNLIQGEKDTYDEALSNCSKQCIFDYQVRL